MPQNLLINSNRQVPNPDSLTALVVTRQCQSVRLGPGQTLGHSQSLCKRKRTAVWSDLASLSGCGDAQLGTRRARCAPRCVCRRWTGRPVSWFPTTHICRYISSNTLTIPISSTTLRSLQMAAAVRTVARQFIFSEIRILDFWSNKGRRVKPTYRHQFYA